MKQITPKICGLKTAFICLIFPDLCGSNILDQLVWGVLTNDLSQSDAAEAGANSKASLLKYLAHGLGRLEWLGLELPGLCAAILLCVYVVFLCGFSSMVVSMLQRNVPQERARQKCVAFDELALKATRITSATYS